MTSIPMSTGYIDVKVKIGKVEFSNTDLQIDSIKINNGCYDGSVFGVGNVYIKNASITMSYRGGISKGLSMEIFFLHQGEWISFGRFIVTETPVISGDKLSVSLESELSQTMTTSVVFEKAMQEYSLKQIKSKIEEIVGRTILFVPDLSNEEYTSFLDGKSACFLKNIQNYVDQSAIDTGISVRDMLSGLAILFGGNAYEDRSDRIIIKQKTYSENSDRYILSDYLDSNYRYSQETYAVRVIGVSFLPWSLSLYYPPNASGQICTVNYLGEDRVDNMIQYDPTAENYTAYDYNISCDWIGWTSDGSTFDTHAPAPGGKYAQCLRQGDLIYKSCEMTFVGIDFGWNIAPGNLIKVQVPELDDPITVLCGEISYEWDGGFTTSVSCSCNIESSGSYSTQVSTRASAVAVQEGRETSLDLNYANITFSNIEDSTIRGSIFKDGTIEGSKIKDATLTGAKIEDATIGFEKVDKSFISNLTADEAYISSLKAEVADIGYLTADEADITYAKITRLEVLESQTAEKLSVKDFEAEAAKIGYLKADEANIKYALITSLEVVDGKIDNLQAITITTDTLNAKVAELGYLKADEANIKYANIELSNIEIANVGTLLSNVGLIDRATIVDGHVTGFLDGVEINANKITAGTLIADRILLKGSEDGLLYALNNLGELTSATVDTLDGYVLTDRTINADKIVASSITANELDVDKIFSNQAVISKITSQEAFINAISSNTVVVGAKTAADNANNKIDNLEIGGANIFPNSTTLIGGGWTGTMADSNVTVGLSDPTGKNNAISMLGTATADNYRIIYNLIPEDGTYTLSLWAKSDKAVKIRNYHGNNKFIGEMDLTTEWKRFVFTKENYLKGDRVYFGGGSSWAKGLKLYVAYPKLEKGNKATDWTAAQSDISVKNIYTPNTTTIDGGKITTNSIKASSIDVDNLFAQDITATGTITGATLKGAKIYSEIGEIAGFTLKDKTFVSEFTQTDTNNAVWDFENEINSKANSEKDFITATCTSHETGIVANKASFGIDGVKLESLNHADDYYDKWMDLGVRSLAFGVNSGTPYNGSNIAFEIDSGYSAITSSGEFTIEPSCTINVPTTVKSLTIKNNGSNGKTVISNGLIGLDDIQGGTVRYFIDNTYGNLRIWDTKVGERLLFSSNSIIFKPKGATVLSINENRAVENGYEIIGCTVTTSGNFTCKKYRDGRLVIECRSKTTSIIGMTKQDTSGIYYATGSGGTFPVAFTDIPSIACGLSVPDGTCPFAHVTFDGISKTGYGREMFWSSFSGNALPIGTVVSAIFTGKWK